MALSNRDRVGKAFELLAEGLRDPIDEVLTAALGPDWNQQMARDDAARHGDTAVRQASKDDVQLQLRMITERGRVFRNVLSRAHQAYAEILRAARNDWAHMKPFSSDETRRTLDAAEQLLHAVNSNDSAADVAQLRRDLEAEVVRSETRTSARRVEVQLSAGAGLKAWRDVVQPHDDVARGEFNASEYAADLHDVANGTASAEYQDPVKFFERTYLTEGLSDLLTKALHRLSGDTNASPIVNLQTNFGGGKTHSMLALYQLFSGRPAADFTQEVQELVAKSGVDSLEKLQVRRVSLVGIDLEAAKASFVDGRPGIRTIWGELAWQLGGAEAYDIVAEADKAGTNPGASLRELLRTYSPALILIDEWVAYARQLVGKENLPGGTFETQFTFAQNLTEAVKSVPGAMLVISIPASDTGGAAKADDIEVGGRNGQLALERLQNVVRRTADQWRPADKDESFEIVRRRLFKAPDANALNDINAIARKFVQFYASQHGQFPVEAEQPAYEARIARSYPIHPELFDRLYEDWSTLPRFQRTRGVLNLLSAVVHALWTSGDQSPLILSGNVPLDDARVSGSFTQYLEDQWKPIIDTDIDGESSTAARIDKARTNLGNKFITRRLARAIFIGAAPRLRQDRRGLGKLHLWLGTATPDDVIGNFGSAIDLLSQQATYFYDDAGQYWFDTQASVTKTAQGYVDQLKTKPEEIWAEVHRRLERGRHQHSLFDGIHVFPDGSGDVPDTEDLRLVILAPEHSYDKRKGPRGADSAAIAAAHAIVERRGSGQRINRNRLVFAAIEDADRDALFDAGATFLAWQQVKDRADDLNLTGARIRQAQQQVEKFERVVDDRINSSYVWALYPVQRDPTRPFTIDAVKAEATGKPIAERVGEKLQREGEIVEAYGTKNVVLNLHERLGSIWDGQGWIGVGDLWKYFNQYPYLPRLRDRRVLNAALTDDAGQGLVPDEYYALATGVEKSEDAAGGSPAAPAGEGTVKFTGLQLVDGSWQAGSFAVTDSTLVVRADLAAKQLAEDAVAAGSPSSGPGTAPFATQIGGAETWGGSGADQPGGEQGTTPAPVGGKSAVTLPALAALPHRFYGSVRLRADRYGQDFTQIAREVIDRLAGPGTRLEITVDIQAVRADGFTESDARTIRENADVLKFDEHGFESE